MPTFDREGATLNNNVTLSEPAGSSAGRRPLDRDLRKNAGRGHSSSVAASKIHSPRLDIEIDGQWNSISPRTG